MHARKVEELHGLYETVTLSGRVLQLLYWTAGGVIALTCPRFAL